MVHYIKKASWWAYGNKDNIILHPETRNWIEAKLNISKGKAPI